MSKRPAIRQSDITEVTSIVGAGDRIRGELHVAGCARIDGVVRGNIERHGNDACAIVSPGGHVRGDIHVHSIRIEGQVVGRVEATGHVEIAASATVDADLQYGTLAIAAGAQVNGRLYGPWSEEA